MLHNFGIRFERSNLVQIGLYFNWVGKVLKIKYLKWDHILNLQI